MNEFLLKPKRFGGAQQSISEEESRSFHCHPTLLMSRYGRVSGMRIVRFELYSAVCLLEEAFSNIERKIHF